MGTFAALLTGMTRFFAASNSPRRRCFFSRTRSFVDFEAYRWYKIIVNYLKK